MEAIQELAGEVRQADQTIMFCCEFLIWPHQRKKIGPHPGLDGTFLTTTGLALQMEAFTLSAVAQIYLYHSHPSCDDSIRQKFSYSLTFEIEFNFQLSEGWLGVTCWNRILCEEITTTTTLL